MQTLILANGTEIQNVEFADTNFIDGRLTIGIKKLDANTMIDILTKFYDKESTKTITLKNGEEIYNTWDGYTILSNIFLNFDVEMITVWLRKE